jgi:hypothetical protein
MSTRAALIDVHIGMPIVCGLNALFIKYCEFQLQCVESTIIT